MVEYESDQVIDVASSSSVRLNMRAAWSDVQPQMSDCRSRRRLSGSSHVVLIAIILFAFWFGDRAPHSSCAWIVSLMLPRSSASHSKRLRASSALHSFRSAMQSIVGQAWAPWQPLQIAQRSSDREPRHWHNATILTRSIGDESLEQRLASYFLRLSQQTPGITISNKGGWHSEDLITDADPGLKELRGLLHEPLVDFLWTSLQGSFPGDRKATSQLYVAAVVDKLWANVNRPGHWNKRHGHGAPTRSLVASCVYYPAGEAYIGAPLKLYPENDEVVEITPYPGMMVLFPPDLQHEVAPVPVGAKARISIAFNVNVRWLDSPLLMAAVAGQDGEVRRLVASGANIEHSDPVLGMRSMHLASEAGHMPVVEVLAQLGADVGARSKDDSTPLSLAAYFGHKDVVSYLTGQSTKALAESDVLMDVFVHDKLCLNGRADATKAENVAMDQGHQAVLGLLAAVKYPELHTLAAGGRWFMASRLLTRRADPSERLAGSGRTALLDAAARGHVQVMDELLEARADVRAKDRHGKCALHEAAANGHVEALEWLREKAGCNAEELDAGDDIQARPIHWAAAFGHTTVVQDLVAAGADLEVAAGGSNPGRPLDWATSRGHTAVRDTLLKLGAPSAAN